MEQGQYGMGRTSWLLSAVKLMCWRRMHGRNCHSLSQAGTVGLGIWCQLHDAPHALLLLLFLLLLSHAIAA